MTSQPDQTHLAQTHLLVDAHVHLHDCFDLAQFLDAALANFQKQSQQLKLEPPVIGALLLAEVSGVNAFADLKANLQSLNEQMSDWEICTTEEDCSLRAKHSDGHTILIPAGRQAVPQEGIQVLALMTAAVVRDRLSLSDTLEQAIAAGGLPVLPWGVGKWIGKRGGLVKQQLETANVPLFTGDNGGRPGFWSLPDYFQQRPQLPGTDPLPLPYEVSRAGSYGFSTQGNIDWAHPCRSLKQILLADQPSIQTYGRSLSPLKFIQSQTLIRLK